MILSVWILARCSLFGIGWWRMSGMSRERRDRRRRARDAWRENRSVMSVREWVDAIGLMAETRKLLKGMK